MTSTINEIEIGEIGNYYGGLSVKEKGGRYYWTIEDWDDKDWQEITKELYDALIKFEENGLNIYADSDDSQCVAVEPQETGLLFRTGRGGSIR